MKNERSKMRDARCEMRDSGLFDDVDNDDIKKFWDLDEDPWEPFFVLETNNN